MNVLVADPSETNRETLAAQVQALNYDVATARTEAHVLRHVTNENYGCVLLYHSISKKSPVSIISEIHRRDSSVPVVVLSSEPSVAEAVDCVKAGADDYQQTPIPPETLYALLKKYNERKDAQAKLGDIESHLSSSNPLIDLQSDDPDMQRVFTLAFRAADTDITILLSGPSGTGKTILAQNIHDRSSRREKPFVTVHCPSLKAELLESELFGHSKGAFTGALSDTWGKVASAEGGTLFLDEIGDLPASIQAKLLRLIQEGCYERVGETSTQKADIRIITATNKDLRTEVDIGNFREDLYYRINVLTLELIPLRNRPVDLKRYIHHYLNFYRNRLNHSDMRFSDKAMQCLLTYPWPGNLRELRNAIERASVLADDKTSIGVDVLPEYLTGSNENRASHSTSNDTLSLHDVEKQHIEEVINNTESMEAAAKALDINSATLYRKRKRMGMK